MTLTQNDHTDIGTLVGYALPFWLGSARSPPCRGTPHGASGADARASALALQAGT